MSSSISYMNSKVSLNFKDPTIYHDRVLIIEGKKFHVVAGVSEKSPKLVLSMWSEHFRGLFTGTFPESNKHEFELKDVYSFEFETFLRLIYQHDVSVVKDYHVIPLIELSHRFLAPVVFELCKKYIDNNFEKLMDITVELLVVACVHGMQNLKVKLLNRLKDVNLLIDLGLTDILEVAYEHNVTDLKYHVTSIMIHSIDEGCVLKYLDCCERFYIPLLKAKVIEEIERWDWCFISPSLIIEVTKAAFKHNLAILKEKVRLNIFYLTSRKGPHQIREEDRMIETSVHTVNWFLKKYHAEIFALPSEISQLIILSTCMKGI